MFYQPFTTGLFEVVGFLQLVFVLVAFGVFVILGIYACTLILSVQRMRRGKLAFFIPLIGGAVAFIAMFVIISIAMSQAPDLFANMTPERLQQLMDSLQMPVK